MKGFGLAAYIVVIGLGAGEFASAQSTTGVSSAPVADIKIDTPSKNWSLRMSATNSTNFFGGTSAAGGSRENSYLLNPSIQATKQLNIGLNLIFTHNLIQSQASDFENTSVLAKVAPIVLVPDLLSLKPSLSGLVPTNRKSREDESLRGGVGAAIGLGADLKRFKLPMNVDYSFGVRRNIHEFNRNDKGVYNNEYRMTQSAALAVEINKRVSLTSTNRFISNIAYSGTLKSSFELAQDIGYQVNDNVSVSVGHSNSGDTLKSDAKSSNVDLINENTSTLSAGVEVVY